MLYWCFKGAIPVCWETDIKIFGKVIKEVGFLFSSNNRLKVVGMNILNLKILNKLPGYK